MTRVRDKKTKEALNQMVAIVTEADSHLEGLSQSTT